MAGRNTISPLGAVARGALAGAAGTAAMSMHQMLQARLQDRSRHDRQPTAEPADPWDSAPAPATVGRRILEGVFHRHVDASAIGGLTQAFHWMHGLAWGTAFGIVQGTLRLPAWLAGPSFGAAVWAASYVELVPMGIYQPPWTYPAGTLATELGYHLTYGAGVATGFELLRRG
jgi:hypothetical protein